MLLYFRWCSIKARDPCWLSKRQSWNEDISAESCFTIRLNKSASIIDTNCLFKHVQMSLLRSKLHLSITCMNLWFVITPFKIVITSPWPKHSLFLFLQDSFPILYSNCSHVGIRTYTYEPVLVLITTLKSSTRYCKVLSDCSSRWLKENVGFAVAEFILWLWFYFWGYSKRSSFLNKLSDIMIS